jgi:hypothetical protein
MWTREKRIQSSSFHPGFSADIGGAGIGSVHFLLATVNTNLLKKDEQNDPINFYDHKCVCPMFDMSLFRWLSWALEESKKNFLSRNFLVIS